MGTPRSWSQSPGSDGDLLCEAGAMIPGLSASWDCVETDIPYLYIHLIGHILTAAAGAGDAGTGKPDFLRQTVTDSPRATSWGQRRGKLERVRHDRGSLVHAVHLD